MESEIAALQARVIDLEEQVRALHQSEDRYRSMIRDSTEGIWRVEHEDGISIRLPVAEQITQILQTGVLAECNLTLARMYGASSIEEMLGKGVKDTFDPSSPRTRAFLRAFIENGYVLYDVESEEKGLDGQPRWFRNSIVGIIENDFLVRAWGWQRDVTESHRAARRFEFQRTFLRNVIESIPSLVFVKDEMGRYMLANEAMADAYGTDVATLEGKLDSDFRDADESEEFRKVDRTVLESGEDAGPYELRMTGANGKTYWLETTKRRIPGIEAGEWYVLGVCNDVTERESTEQELTKIRQAIDFASDAISITDLQGNVTYANPAFERLTGFTVDELRAVGGPRDLYANDDDLQQVFAKVNTGGSYEGEVAIRHRDGGLLIVFQRIDLIRDPDGTPISILAVRTDIGERKRLEAQLRQAEKLAALGELVAGVAHELNNPVATISAHAQLLLRSEDIQVRKRAEGILRMVDRTSRIGKSLLTFARNTHPDAKRNSITEIVEESLELCATRLRRQGITLSIDLMTPAPWIFVDESQIEQIVVNLVNNAAYAMKDSPDRTLEVRTWAEGDRAFLTVSDRGPGIPAEIQGRIFEPFFTTKPMGEGTGLGLSICHGLAVANQGTLEFRARADRGSIFTLTLPRVAIHTETKEGLR